jgi:N-methylhydantoinase A
MNDLRVQSDRGPCLRIGVDVGSTFTDLVYVDPATQGLQVSKHLTSPDRLTGVVEVLDASITGDKRFSAADYFFHATTIGINTLLERSGPTLGMLVTAGFRDLLEWRRATRHDARGPRMYDLMWKAPPPLVPRELRQPIRERVASDGTVVVPVDPADIRTACDIFRRKGVSCVAVAFFNAYVNPSHEIQAAEMLREAGFTGDISLSHKLSREIYEYERASTTAIDAYIRPGVAHYLGVLEAELRARSFAGDCLITLSGGGSAHFDEARTFETIMSGPVAGAVAAGHLANMHGVKRAIAIDGGGTSFDTCLLVGGKPRLLYEGKVLGMPVQAPWTDISSIGAGGGSIAHVEGGLLRVGPQSAGANPGPACYRRGGVEATVTDAAATLGMLADGQLAGGLQLDLALAHRVISKLGAPLGLDADATARGIIAVTTAAMAAAMRSVTVGVGEDPRDMALIAYGGAGPLFAGLLARELGIAYTLVPNHAGNFSACGLLMQEPTRTASQTALMPLTEGTIPESDRILTGLFAQLDRLPTRVHGNEEAGKFEVRLAAADLHYVGQEHALTIDVPCHPNGAIDASALDLQRAFESAYSRQFGYTMEVPIEIVALRATIRTRLPEITVTPGTAGGSASGSIQAFSFTAQERVDFAVTDRSALRPGGTMAGPAIIREPTATTFLDIGSVARVLQDQTLQIREEGKP